MSVRDKEWLSRCCREPQSSFVLFLTALAPPPFNFLPEGWWSYYIELLKWRWQMVPSRELTLVNSAVQAQCWELWGLVWAQLERVLGLTRDDWHGCRKKSISTHARQFLCLHLSKETQGQIRVYNPKYKSNLMEPGARESTIAPALVLNYVEYGSTLIFLRNIIREFCKPTILELILVF